MPSREERKAAKKARRKFRREMERRMFDVAIRRIGKFSRQAQLHSAAKILTDRYMHQVDHAPVTVKPIEEVNATD